MLEPRTQHLQAFWAYELANTVGDSDAARSALYAFAVQYTMAGYNGFVNAPPNVRERAGRRLSPAAAAHDVGTPSNSTNSLVSPNPHGPRRWQAPSVCRCSSPSSSSSPRARGTPHSRPTRRRHRLRPPASRWRRAAPRSAARGTRPRSGSRAFQPNRCFAGRCRRAPFQADAARA